MQGAKLTGHPKLDSVPVFVRAGTILPRQPLVQSTAQKPSGPLQLDVYLGEDCRGDLYFDDGISVNGPSLRQNLQCSETPNGVELRFGKRQGSYRPWWKQIVVTVHGARPMRMTIADQPRAGKLVVHQ